MPNSAPSRENGHTDCVVAYFVFGISLGSNKEIVSDFGRLGITSVIVALMGVAGSVLAAWGLKSVIDRNRNK